MGTRALSSALQAVTTLLREQGTLSEHERAELLRLVWLLGKVPGDVRIAALARLKPILENSQPGSQSFYDQIHRLVRELDHVHQA